MSTAEKDAIQRRDEAIELIAKHGDARGEKEKAWVIDQVLQTLLGREYEEWVRSYESQDGGERDRTWETGSQPEPLPEDFHKILDIATQIFGSKERADEWIVAHVTALGGKSPLEKLREPGGDKEVMRVLRRIQTGDFS